MSVETVEFANESTAEMLGVQDKFELKIDGDTIDQKGIGGSATHGMKSGCG